MPRLGLILLLATLGWTHAQTTRPFIGEGCTSSADFIFVLDSSGSLVDQSLRSNNWFYIQQFVETAVLNIGRTVEGNYTGASAGLRFGLIQFRDVGVITVGLNDFDNYTMAARIMGLATNLGGQTNLAAGLLEAEKMLTPRRQGNVRNPIIIVISDWDPYNFTVRSDAISIARRLESQYGATIVTVGVLGSVDQRFLNEVATQGRFGPRNVMSEDHQSLLMHITPFINVACETGPSGGGSCERDVVFALDASYSLSQDQNFERLKEFVIQVAGNIYNTARDTRMGVVVFSTNANITIPLQLYSNAFASQIKAISVTPMLTNHADALRKTRDLLAGSTRTKFAIIFTDGRTTAETQNVNEIARDMRENDNIVIIAFGVSNKIDYGTLEKLVGRDKTSTNIFWSPDFKTNMIAQLNLLTQTAEGCPARDLPCDPRPPEVIIALDASGSIRDKGPLNWGLMQDFGVEVVNQIRQTYLDSRVGALIFSDRAVQIAPLTSDTQSVVNAIRAAEHINGFTNEADAFRVAGSMLDRGRSSSYKYVIMVTDGQPTLEIDREIQEAAILQAKNITRVMIGVTNDIKMDRLNKLGSAPPERYVLFTENFNTLNARQFISSVVTAAGQCQGPIPQPTPPPRQCFGADIVILMDSSGSIEEKGKGNFNRLREFTANLAQNIALRYTGTRFGFVLFSDLGRLVASLSQYRSIVEFTDIVRQQRYSGSQTNIASALREGRKDLNNYGRNNPTILLITDGEPTAEMNNTVREADLTRSRNIRIAAIGITYSVARETLERITGNSNYVYLTPMFDTLQNEIVDVTEVACEGIRAISPCSGATEVVFSLDASGSIEQLSPTAWRDALNLIKSGIGAFANFNRNTRFGFVVFSDVGRTEFGLTDQVAGLSALVDRAIYDRGRTNIADGIEVARREIFTGSRNGAYKILILITDGEPNERERDTLREADYAKQSGINIVTVGITENGPDYTLLNQIASSPSQVLRSLSFNELNSQIGMLVQASCRPDPNNPNIPFDPIRTTKPPFNRPSTDVTRFVPGVSSRTTRIFFTPFPRFTPPNRNTITPRLPYQYTQAPLAPRARPNAAISSPSTSRVHAIPQQCNGGYIVLLLDVSMRLHYKTIPQRGIDGLGEMAARIVDTLARLHPDAKFAVVTYDATATAVRDFSQYRNAHELMAFLRQLTYTPDYDSNIAASLLTAKEVLRRAQASRSMTLLITDGVTTLDDGMERTRANELRANGTELVVIAVSRSYNEQRIVGITQDKPRHYIAEEYRFDPSLLSRYYKTCNQNTNSVVALRSNTEQQCPTEIVFVIDSSQGMNGNEWDNLRLLLVSLVEKVSNNNPEIKFASVMFGDHAQLGFYLSDNIPDIKARLRSLQQMGGGTNIFSGLHAVRNYIFQDRRAKQLALVFVNGDPTMEVSQTSDEAGKLRELGTKVKVVVRAPSITDMPSKEMLERIAGRADGVLRIPNFYTLESKVDEIANMVCSGATQQGLPPL